MATNPFFNPPRDTFRSRMALPSALAFVIGFVAMGVISASSPILPRLGPVRSIGANLQVIVTVPPLRAAHHHWVETASIWINYPKECSGVIASDFQESVCDSFRHKLLLATAVALLPFVLSFLLFYLARDQVLSFYRRTYRKIDSGKADWVATVTDPPQGKRDFFSWLFCLEPIMVQLADHRQVRVYLPVSSPQPRAGQKLALFKSPHILGSSRYVAIVHHPQMKVLG